MLVVVLIVFHLFCLLLLLVRAPSFFLEYGMSFDHWYHIPPRNSSSNAKQEQTKQLKNRKEASVDVCLHEHVRQAFEQQ